MAKTVKGIRVNALAKELGVESKAILDKLKSEGLSVPNHQSTVSLGLAESIKEWFSHAGGTAVETAPPVEASTIAAKPKLSRSKKKKGAEEGDASDEGIGGSCFCMYRI